jgi:hypothetical protein
VPPVGAGRTRGANHREGCTETLDCTSQRQVPVTKYCQGPLPADAASSVSRYIKEEDEVIDLNYPGAGEYRPKGQRPQKGALSVQAQTMGEAEGPLQLTSLSPTGDRFARRRLLCTTVQVNEQAVTALLDSGCEAKLVLSQRFADSHGIQYGQSAGWSASLKEARSRPPGLSQYY